MKAEWAEWLEAAAGAARLVAARHVAALTADDRRELVLAFHRAESLAEHALAAALPQVEPGYRDELTEQLADERRHVAVFAGWQDADAAAVVPPRARERPQAVWLMMLLANELTGYCQFQLLLALLGDAGRVAAVAEILADEERHIARLAGWLAPVWGTRPSRVLIDFTRGFRRGLEGRMSQFFPRAELAELRIELARIVDRLLAAFTEPEGATSSSRIA